MWRLRTVPIPDDPSDADADADNDGLTNGDEVSAGTNPNVADTDGDGVNDSQEILLGYSPTDPNSTPPANATLAKYQCLLQTRSILPSTQCWDRTRCNCV